VIIVPSAQLQQLADIAATVKASDALEFSAEVAHSSVDVNRLSTLDDNSNGGNALKASIRYTPKEIRISETSLGAMDLSFQERYIDSRFVSIDRINDIEYARKWNIDSTVSQSSQVGRNPSGDAVIRANNVDRIRRDIRHLRARKHFFIDAFVCLRPCRNGSEEDRRLFR